MTEEPKEPLDVEETTPPEGEAPEEAAPEGGEGEE